VGRDHLEPDPQHAGNNTAADGRYQHNTPEVHRTRLVSLMIAPATFHLAPVYRIVNKRRDMRDPTCGSTVPVRAAILQEAVDERSIADACHRLDWSVSTAAAPRMGVGYTTAAVTATHQSARLVRQTVLPCDTCPFSWSQQRGYNRDVNLLPQ
jgi:hypothetical protein